jgi:hypothetical protein
MSKPETTSGKTDPLSYVAKRRQMYKNMDETVWREAIQDLLENVISKLMENGTLTFNDLDPKAVATLTSFNDIKILYPKPGEENNG